MKARLEAENPEKIEFTLSMTLRLEDWRKFHGQIKLDGNAGSYPGYNFKSQIEDMISQAERNFIPEIDDEE